MPAWNFVARRQDKERQSTQLRQLSGTGGLAPCIPRPRLASKERTRTRAGGNAGNRAGISAHQCCSDFAVTGSSTVGAVAGVAGRAALSWPSTYSRRFLNSPATAVFVLQLSPAFLAAYHKIFFEAGCTTSKMMTPLPELTTPTGTGCIVPVSYTRTTRSALLASCTSWNRPHFSSSLWLGSSKGESSTRRVLKPFVLKYFTWPETR